MRELIQYEDFEKVDIRSGTVVNVEEFPRAKNPAYKVWVDFGEIGIKKTSAQVTKRYRPEELMGRQVIGVVNLGTKNIAGFESEFLMVGFTDENGGICLATVDPRVPNGGNLH